MSIGKLTGVSSTGKQALALSWDDGRTAKVDLSAVIAGRKVLATLNDPIVFARATLSADGWSVEWPDGPDFGAQQLRRWMDEQAGDEGGVAGDGRI